MYSINLFNNSINIYIFLFLLGKINMTNNEKIPNITPRINQSPFPYPFDSAIELQLKANISQMINVIIATLLQMLKSCT